MRRSRTCGAAAVLAAAGAFLPTGAAPGAAPGPVPEQAETVGQNDSRPRLPRPRPEPSAPQTPLVALLPEVRPDPTRAVKLLSPSGRLPRARPEAAAELASVQPGAAPNPPAPTGAPEPAVSTADAEACRARLSELGVAFQQLPPIADGEGCSVPEPIAVSSVGSGVALKPAATLNCPTAEALARWTRDSLVPAARTHLNATPTAIAPGSGYACRPRNNQAGAKVSEHASANAFDVAAVEFDNRPAVVVRTYGPGEKEGAFLAEIRADACAFFTTVLGPGSDAAHETHLHFDLAERRGGYRLCSLGGALAADKP